MKFLVDNQLPKALAKWLVDRGYNAVHVLERGQGQTEDGLIWKEAAEEGRIVISKDEDFLFLATRPSDQGRLLWIRVGNCRTAFLLETLAKAWPGITEAFESGQNVVELR